MVVTSPGVASQDPKPTTPGTKTGASAALAPAPAPLKAAVKEAPKAAQPAVVPKPEEPEPKEAPAPKAVPPPPVPIAPQPEHLKPEETAAPIPPPAVPVSPPQQEQPKPVTTRKSLLVSPPPPATPSEQPKPLITRKTLPWLQDPKPQAAPPEKAVSSSDPVKTPVDGSPAVLSTNNGEQPSSNTLKPKDGIPASGPTVPAVDTSKASDNAATDKKSTDPAPANVLSSTKPFSDISAPTSPAPVTYTKPAINNVENQPHKPSLVPPRAPEDEDTVSTPTPISLASIRYWRHPRTQALPIRPLAAANPIQDAPKEAAPVPQSAEQHPGPPNIPLGIPATEPALQPREVGTAPAQAAKDLGPLVEEAGPPASQAEVAALGGYFQPRRVRDPAFGRKAVEVLEKLAEKAVKGVEAVGDEVVGEVEKAVDPKTIRYWSPKRARSPEAWHKARQAAAVIGNELQKLEVAVVKPLDELTEGFEHAVDPRTIGYWRPERVADPHGFWKNTAKFVTAPVNTLEKAAKAVAEPVEETIESIEKAVDPSTITYWNPKRVRSPAAFWAKPVKAVKVLQEDVKKAVQALDPVHNVSESTKKAAKISDPSPSEYSRDDSHDYRRSSSCSLGSSESDSSGQRHPQTAPVPVSSSYLWQNRQRRVSHSADANERDLRRKARQIERAINGLNNLMEEALTVARDAAHSGHPDDIAHLFEHASQTLRQATSKHELRSYRQSTGGDDYSSTVSNFSDDSRMHTREGSAETAPTVFTKSGQSSRQPVLVQRDRPPVSRKALVEGDRSSEESMMMTPPHLYHPPSADSVVKDFAYTGPMRRHAKPRSDDPVELHQLGLPPALTRKSEPIIELKQPPLAAKSSTIAERRRKSTQPANPLMLPSDAAELSKRPSSSSPSSPSGEDETTTRNKQIALEHPRRRHISLDNGQGFSLGRHHVRQPIAREWMMSRKRMTAIVACLNTIFIGLIAGIYAGEVPRIQYQIADTDHIVIYGNVLLFSGVGISTLIFWPLPLLHGRKAYTLAAFGLMLPLQFPQAIAIAGYRDTHSLLARIGLLLPRALTGFAMGFANINQLPTLLDLFGASLQSENPHQEIVVPDDMRHQGGGIGLWLGIWTWCSIGSLSLGFCVGACIISKLDPSWGFYLVIILLALFLSVNVIAPETRRSPYRRSLIHFFDSDDKIKRRVAKGEVKLHISNSGPKWWFEEVWAGVILTKRMVFQFGYFLMMLYLAWIYALVVLVIITLGALLSRDYAWQSQFVGLASLALTVGALLAVPLTHGNLFSRARWKSKRSDSMTFHHAHYVWTSHMARRCMFTLMLPLAGAAYTLTSGGPDMSWVAPVVFVGLVGFLSNLAITECIGIIMETFDTCDLQPGANSKHRVKSLPFQTAKRRTNYSSYPRVCAALFAAQSLGFFLAAAATAVSGTMTRALGAQISTAVVASVLLVLTIFLLIVLFRWKGVQVIPDGVLADAGSATLPNSKGGTAAFTGTGAQVMNGNGQNGDWKPVVIGNPSGKMRRMNILEMGKWSRWSEIRRLNRLDQ